MTINKSEFAFTEMIKSGKPLPLHFFEAFFNNLLIVGLSELFHSKTI